MKSCPFFAYFPIHNGRTTVLPLQETMRTSTWEREYLATLLSRLSRELMV